MLISAVHTEHGEERLHLLMVDDAIPAGAKLCRSFPFAASPANVFLPGAPLRREVRFQADAGPCHPFSGSFSGLPRLSGHRCHDSENL